MAGGPGDKGTASFSYEVGTYASYQTIASLDDESVPMGRVSIYDDGSYIYIHVAVWSKPYLAYGELDKNGDGVIDADKYDTKKDGQMKGDKNKDGTIDHNDLGSDGITIEGLGNPHEGKDTGYRWYVDSKDDDTPKKYRDPEITVPSWTPTGILTGPINYYAKIPIPSGERTLKIDIEVHASPPRGPPPFVVPEFAIGTIGPMIASAAALYITKKQRN